MGAPDLDCQRLLRRMSALRPQWMEGAYLRPCWFEPTQVRLVGWRERAPFYDQVAALYSGVFWFLGTIIFVLVVLSASNVLLMSILAFFISPEEVQ